MKFFQFIPNNLNIDFVGKFKLFVAISTLSVAASLFGMFTKGFNFGIDFTGGAVVQIKYKQPTPIDEVRKTVDALGDEGASVVAMDKTDQEYLITARQATKEGEGSLPVLLLNKVGPDKASITQADIVGPKVGSELKLSAIRSMIYTIILIMVYIWLRFDFRFAPGATVALVHDMTVAAGYYVFTGREFDITAIAALLTIAGYGVNDTIVIYDRVRELIKLGDNSDLAQTINKAINLTLSRTVITSGVTFLSVVPIAVFCSGPIQDFAETMLIGIFVGTYSTYYIAAPLTIYVEKWMGKKQAPRRVASV
ncbi:protein translocase subunit SecF [bacterium]|nr:protein translocase subunit SecF [bacterium]